MCVVYSSYGNSRFGHNDAQVTPGPSVATLAHLCMHQLLQSGHLEMESCLEEELWQMQLHGRCEQL